MEPTISEAPAHVLFEEQARRTPGATAVRCGAESLSYSALDRRANQVASRLHALGVGAEDRVGICLDRSIELVIAVLGVLKAGGAYVPLDPAYPARRLAFMLDDAGASAVLTRRRWRELVVGRGAALCFDGDDGLDGERAEPPRVAVRASDLAYVLYTSGSTGVPKGVMIEHGSVTALAAALVPLFDVRPESRVLQFASPCFDVSVSEMWMAWRAGAELHLAPRDELIPGPALVRLLRERAITHASLPPSALSALPDADLPALAAIISAGEACPPDLAARWGEGRRFFNAYGPTEATVYATVHAFQRGDRRVPIGRSLEGRHVAVLDAEGCPLSAGEAGELCLGGRGVARGYWRRPDLTAERFIPDAGGGRLYRTGDLARVLPDGTIEYLGRLDHQVKVRGFRVELGEIEAVLRRQGSVRDVVVVGREDGAGPKRLVAYVVRAPGGEGSAAAWRHAVAGELPEHMVPSVFVELPALPLSPSGKVDRAALPAPGSERPALAPAYVAPRTATERALATIWEAVLGVSPVGLDDDLLGLGGDSLHAARILARVVDAFGVEIPFRDLFEARTLARFAERIEAGGEAALPLVPGRERALSHAQERLWFLHQLAPASAAYAVPALLHARGALDVPALARALGALTDRHEPLRTRIVVAGDRPAPVVDPPTVPALAVTDLRASRGALLGLCREEAARPFDLAQGPLLRARLFRVADDEHVLCLVMHHVASDGWSLRVLVEDLAALYDGAGASLPPLPIRYGDHAAWQRERMARGALDRELAYWKAELDGAPARLDLPADRPRPPVLRFRGARCPFRLSGALTAALDALCRAEGVTRFMALLAAVNALLHRYTGAEDIVVGTPVAGRSRLEIEGLVGFFANTLAIRTRLDGDPTGRALLARVRERALGAFAHQELPFERLVEALRVERDPAHHPVFQVMFALQEPLPEVERGGVAFRLEDLDTGAAPFDLSCQVWGGEGGLTGEIVYDTDLFDASTAQAMAGHLEALLERLTAAPERRLSELLVLSEADVQLRATLPAVEARVLAMPGVEDAAVLLRSASLREQEIVAYAATTCRVPDVVPVPVVPRTQEGVVDARALRRLPVVDAAALQRWEAELRALPGVREVAVTIQEPAARTPLLHLADLLPASLVPTLSGSASPPAPPGRSLDAPSVSATPAHANGGPLDIADGEPATLAAALLRTASTYPDRGVTVVTAQGGESFLSYAALLREARRALAGLRERGLRAGDRVLLQVASLADHLVAFWGCVLGGITPAAVAIAPTYEIPGGVTAKLHSAWELLGRPAIVASARLAPAIRGLAALYPMPGMVVLPVEELREHPPAERHHEARPEDVAFLQLTSGSTGVPKCIQVTHRGILRHVHGVTRFNGYHAGDVWLNWLPFDHVGAILTVHLKDVVLGCNEVQVETERVLADPLAWLDRMEAHRVTHSWSPNFGYKLVSDAIAAAPGRSWDLSSVARLMNGGEQVTAKVARAFLRAVAPFGVRSSAMQPAFGMAEACTCIAYDNTFQPETSGSDAPFVELGPPIPGVEIRITDAGNRVVPEGVIGRMQIRGGVVTPGYLHDEAANGEAFVGDGWFNSGDLGFLAGGRLTLTGREKETIIVRGANFYAHEIEDVVNAVPGVEPTFAAACAVDDPRHGTEGLAVFFVPRGEAATTEAGAALREAVRAEVTARLGVVPAVVLPIPRADFPKTTSGKIQRSALGRALREGRFAEISRELDLAAGSPATLPDWFHAPAWQEREASPLRPLPAGGAALVVGDRSGLGDCVAAALTREGLRVRSIRRGEDAAVVGPVDHVIHVAGYDGGGDDAVDLLALVQALLRAGGPGLAPGSVRLTVVSRRAQPVLPGEAIASEKAPVLGLVRTIPHEIPWLDARHLDLEGDDLDADAQAVVEELRGLRRDREIARRGGRRWALGLARVDLAAAPPRPLPFTPGGVYLVTGGLGGIGVRVAGLLLARYGARLLLVGRSPLDGERISALHALAAGGEGEAVYEQVDVADAGALEAAVRCVEARWGRALDGAIHLAGVFAPRPLADETPETLASSLRPAVEGGRSVRAILDARPGAALVAVSSVTGFFGGFAVGAYAAASRFTEHLAHALGPRARCLSFSEWDDVGMTRENPMRDLSRARGFQAVSPERGLSSLLAGLHRGPPRLLVGLDRRSPHVLRHLHGASVAPPRVVAFVAADRAPEAALHDRFGVRVAVEIRRVERLPRAPDGTVDQAALSDAPAAEARGGGLPVAPRDEVEAAVARIWQELLGVDRVGVHDSFFALGGHSMMLARARVRLEAAFAREIAVVDLFRHPTVATLAAYLRDEARAPSGVRERAARQRAALAAPPPAARARRKIHG